jgi:ribokinase
LSSVIVVGSVNLDIVASVAKLPRPGETVTGATLQKYPGGKGANQALAACRLGADVTLLADVGDDPEAEEALALLRDGGVDLTKLAVSGSLSTGTALIAVSNAGENQIVVAPGANSELEIESIPEADAMICQLEVPEATVARAATLFTGLFCINLAPAKHVDVSILQRADLVVVNETEAEWYGNSLAACGGTLAKTHGSRGAELMQGDAVIASATPPAIDVVDTTAAGDAFTAALTVALVEGMAPQKALEFACAAGALACTKAGAQPSLPTREEVENIL